MKEGCICRWIDYDTLIVDPTCHSTDHGGISERMRRIERMISESSVGIQTELVGQCFRVETSWGDDSPSWYVYRRVRRVMSNMVECHRFETRSPQDLVTAGPMYVVMTQDVIPVRTLLRQVLVEESEWVLRWEQFSRAVGVPWNVE